MYLTAFLKSDSKEADTMDKLYKVMIILGICMVAFYGFQWYSGKQAVEESTMEESELFSSSVSGKVINQDTKKEYKVTRDPVMSNEVDQYADGEEVAWLEIPSINSAYRVYWGADDETLKQGVGMYVSEWTTTPEEQRHTVLSGHRDTVFSELESIVEGERLALRYKEETYIYEVNSIWVTDANDRTVIVDKDEATLTLTTCYPFQYLGNAPDRYIIQSSLVEVKKG